MTVNLFLQEVITFMETTKYPQHDDEQYFNKRRFVRQVTRTEKDTSDWKTGKLNGKSFLLLKAIISHMFIRVLSFHIIICVMVVIGRNDKARIHIELNKDPKMIEEAVQEVITYMGTTKYPLHDDEQYFNKRRFVRQVTRTEKDTSDWKTGKLNGKRPLTIQKEPFHKYALVQ
jgi:uncharacterized protein (DUF2267 family)